MPTPVSAPRRLQARRDSNYRLVARPTRWGNPFPLSEHTREESIRRYAAWLEERLATDPEFLEPLRGYNLGCFCSLDLPCHVDVLLEHLYSESSS